MLDSYFKNGDVSHHTPDMRDHTMVATDVHRCLSLLKNTTSGVSDQDESSALTIGRDEEKKQTEIALRALIADQISESKKQELFAYIGAHENLFT